ncbi:amino acid transmembrane transporter [Schizosaccharomyces osmophilus]|uniref:Amino acid transmembrane transporter n=1 Tax=Schizosaccharomyces osmophilus TaxID=2545709 RepID=A0AAF0AUW5_9SCHI|nr:amino acid transmembrane transporter [Schizosaccharomyces osmophilus]WBW72916.1 amino acid transmembrane transporter [Schizosaccharomyces osmophilus]
MTSLLEKDQKVPAVEVTKEAVSVNSPGLKDVELGESVALADDDKMLMSLGYKPVFQRKFSYLSVFGQSFGAMGLCPSISGSLIFAMNCGSGGMVWSWFLGCFCLLPVAISMSELASSMPTSGSLYYWIAKLSPKKYRAFLSWLLGYVSMLAYGTGFASTVYAASSLLIATISVGNSGFSPTKYEQYGIYIAFSIACSFLIAMPTNYLAHFNKFCVFFQISTALIIIISLAASSNSHTRTSASYIFTNFHNYSSWKNTGWAFIMSFTTPVWVVSGFESCATVAEEATNPSVAAPIALISSLSAALVLGFCVMVTICATMGFDFEAIMNSTTGEPVIQVLLNNLGVNGCLGVSSVLIVALCLNCSCLCVGATREVFAFSRDGGLPASKYLSKITSKGVPINAIIGVDIYAILIGLLMLVNEAAISSVFNLAIIALFVVYSLPFLARILFDRLKPGTYFILAFLLTLQLVNSIVESLVNR